MWCITVAVVLFYVTYRGLNRKKMGTFSYGANIPWFGMAVTSDVISFIWPFSSGEGFDCEASSVPAL